MLDMDYYERKKCLVIKLISGIARQAGENCTRYIPTKIVLNMANN